MVACDRPAYVPKHADQHAEHEDKSVLGFVDSTIALGHPDNSPGTGASGDEYCEDDSKEASQIRQTLIESTDICISGEYDVIADEETHDLGRVEVILNGEDGGRAERDYGCFGVSALRREKR